MKKHILIGPASILLLWALFTYSGIIKPILLPPPHAVALSLIKGLFINYELAKPLLRTFLIWMLSFSAGSIAGVVLGILAGYSDKIYSSLEISIDFFRSLPSLLIAPIIIIFFGIGYLSTFIIISWATFFYVFIDTVYGVKYGRKNYLLVCKILKIPKMQQFEKVILPSSLPYVFAGLRLGLSVALIVTIGVEMILGKAGLGGLVYDAYMIYDVTRIYAIIVLVGLLGYVSNRILVYAEHRIIHWRGE